MEASFVNINLVRFLLAVLAAGLATSFTDWLFMGVLFHGQYLATPEIWRSKPGEPDVKRIIASTLVGVVSCAAFLTLCAWTGALNLSNALSLAVLVWLAGSAPVIITNAFWIKLHPLLSISHSLGWLARFIVCAFAAAWI